MKSGSWSSYQAALPHEAKSCGERDDEVRHHAPPNCSGCGRFIGNTESGSRIDSIPGSIFGAARDDFWCKDCAKTAPLPPTAAELAERERAEIAAYDRMMAETWQAEADAARGKCQYCGASVDPSLAYPTCEKCADAWFDATHPDGDTPLC